MQRAWFRIPLSVAVAVLAGCAASPVGVQRMDPAAVHRSLTANALSEDVPSVDSRNVLYRRDLALAFEKRPVAALAELHRIALAHDDDETWFALAELSFLHSQKADDPRYAMMSALYAWAYLYEGTPPDPTDPRLRIAMDLYNRGLTEGLTPKGAHLVQLANETMELPIGSVALHFDDTQLHWNGRHLRDFVPVAELEVHGLNYRYRTPGLGAPLAANAGVDDPDQSTDFLAGRLKIPVTALARMQNVRKQLAQGHVEATLELHADPNEQKVAVEGGEVPLEKEPTAVLAAMLASSPVIRDEIAAFFGKMTLAQSGSRLAALRPHVRGRIPVVFVHGTASSPARWAEMVNVLDNDPRLNSRYEPWFFAYNSSGPIIYSAYMLRDSLKKAVAMLDPDGTDPGIRNMVVIGHSQGGLLTKMTAVSSGDRFWNNFTDKPFESVHVQGSNRQVLHDAFFVEPLPFVKRVVFICTPHRGSFIAASDWVRSIVNRLITLPARVTLLATDVLTLNPDVGTRFNLRNANAVENMSPNNPFVKTLSTIPVAPGVSDNSIIAVLGEGGPSGLNDGVVEYDSAHIEPVESEYIVHSGHSTQAEPDTIEEVRRILLKHAGVAAAGAAAAVPVSAAAPAANRRQVIVKEKVTPPESKPAAAAGH